MNDSYSCSLLSIWWANNACVLSHFGCVRLFVTLWTIACQASLFMEFSRQEYWSGLSFPSPGDLPAQGIEPGSSALQVDSLPSEPLGKRKCLLISRLKSPSTVILTPKKIKSVTVSTFSPSICHQVLGTMPWSLFSESWVLSQLFCFPPSSRGFLVPLHFLPLEWNRLHI